MVARRITRTPAAPTSTPTDARTVVATVLDPDDRMRVDAAGSGIYRTVHRDSLEDILRDLRGGGADAVLVGLKRAEGSATKTLAKLVREFPQVPAVALMSDTDPSAATTALTLGQVGVSRLVDVRSRAGWQELRLLLAQQRQDAAERRMLALVRERLPEAPRDLRRTLELMVTQASRIRTVRELAATLGVRAASLTSRFYRAGVPAPKKYLAMIRLVRAAAMLENPGISIAQVAYRLGYGTPQCFNRHIRRWTSCTAYEFRTAIRLDGMLERFADELLDGPRPQLLQLHPLGGTPHAPPKAMQAIAAARRLAA